MSIIGGIATGLVANAMDNNRQKKIYGQQKKLMGIQHQNQMALNKQMQDIQMQNWENTNYKAQMEQMKKAGLNVGMMYGGSGAGGATMGGASGGSAASGSAPSMEQGGSKLMGIGLESAMMESQMELIKAQTEKTKAEAEKTKGVDTEKAGAEINSINQGIDNAKASEELIKVETELKGLEYDLKWATFNDSIGLVNTELKKGLKSIYILEQQGKINKAEADIADENWRLKLNQTLLENVLLKSKNKESIANTEKIKEETSVIFKDYLTRAKNANTNERAQMFQDMRAEMQQKLQQSGLDLQESKMYLDALIDMIGFGKDIGTKTR